MTGSDPFFQPILDNPEDENLRLICADWFEERGDAASLARAEFIRLQCELHRLGPAADIPWALYTRQQMLLQAWVRDWNGPLHERLHRGGLVRQVFSRHGPVRPWIYRRGFVEALSVRGDVLVRFSPLLFRLGPIRHLRTWDVPAAALAGCPELARLNTLDLTRCNLTNSEIQTIVFSPHLWRLPCLYVRGDTIGADGRKTLSRYAMHSGTQVVFNRGADDLFAPAAPTKK